MVLLNAAKKDVVEVAKQLINSGANVNVKDCWGNTPLVYAIKNRNTEMIKLLLSNGADNEPKLLCTAAENGSLTIVEDLLKYGADVNMLDSSRFGESLTSLHCAVKKNQVDVAKLLINYGADVNVNDSKGRTPIVYAIENRNTEMTKLFLTNGADIKDNPSLLCTAAENGGLEIVEDLLKYGADVNMLNSLRLGKDLTALHHAAVTNHVEVAKLLIKYGANVNVKDGKGRTPIGYAIENKNTEMTKLLLTNGADIKDHSILQCIAARNGGRNLVEDVLKYSPHIIVNSSLLCTAASNGSLEIVEDLLKYGADVNVKDYWGTTPLVYAIENRNTEMTKLLLTNGADIEDNPSLLCTAAENGGLKIVEELLKYGVDVDMLNHSGVEIGLAPLHSAVKYHQVEVAELLINYGANVNVKDSVGRTPMFYAIEQKDMEMTELLLSNEADINEDLRVLCTNSGFITLIIIQHIAKMKAAGLHVSQRNLLLISNSHVINNFLFKCEEEIEIMKSERIDNSRASFYDILTKNTSQLVKNKSIVRALKSDDYKTKFPIFFSMIDNRFRRGVEREELLEQVRNRLLYPCYNSFPVLPLPCTDKILSYLSKKDLRILLISCKP